jgi:hypothetical protein
MTTTNDDFFANAPTNYEVPKGDSKYMKFEQGDNKFRILEKPIFGWEGWEAGSDGKDTAKRFKYDAKPVDLRPFRNQRLNHFWAMPVWNYKSQAVEVLQITQKSILGAIESLCRNEDWGSPLTYNLTVNKTGTTKEDTKYQVSPAPHKAVAQEVVDAFAKVKAAGFDITALYDGGDPFAPGVSDEIKPEDIPFD